MHTTTKFTDMMYANYFESPISRPTRISKSSTTLIDNIFNYNFDGLTSGTQCVLVTDISDHFPAVYINVEWQIWSWSNTNETHVFIWKQNYFTKLFKICTGTRYIKTLTPRGQKRIIWGTAEPYSYWKWFIQENHINQNASTGFDEVTVSILKI